MKSVYVPKVGFVSKVKADDVTEIQLVVELVSVKPHPTLSPGAPLMTPPSGYR